MSAVATDPAFRRNQSPALTRGRKTGNDSGLTRPIYPAVLKFEAEHNCRLTIAEGEHLWRVEICYRGPDIESLILVCYLAPAFPTVPTLVARSGPMTQETYPEDLPSHETIDEWVADILAKERASMTPPTAETARTAI